MSAALKETPSHLLGNGRPVAEEITLTDLKVTGAIPRELDGPGVTWRPSAGTLPTQVLGEFDPVTGRFPVRIMYPEQFRGQCIKLKPQNLAVFKDKPSA